MENIQITMNSSPIVLATQGKYCENNIEVNYVGSTGVNFTTISSEEQLNVAKTASQNGWVMFMWDGETSTTLGYHLTKYHFYAMLNTDLIELYGNEDNLTAGDSSTLVDISTMMTTDPTAAPWCGKRIWLDLTGIDTVQFGRTTYDESGTYNYEIQTANGSVIVNTISFTLKPDATINKYLYEYIQGETDGDWIWQVKSTVYDGTVIE